MRAEPLTPERLLELERLQDAYRDVSARFDDALRTQGSPDVMLTVEVGGAYRALREALFDAGPELVRVYRAAWAVADALSECRNTETNGQAEAALENLERSELQLAEVFGE